MNWETEKRVLERLALLDTKEPHEIISKKFEEISSAASECVDLQSVNILIEQLGPVAIRFPDESVTLIEDVLQKVFFFNENYSALDDETIQINEHLRSVCIDCIEILKTIRYLSSPGVFRVLLNLGRANDEAIANFAIEALRSMAEFNISVIYGQDSQPGIGFHVQSQLLDILNGYSDLELLANLTPVLAVYDEFLSPEMEAIKSDYKTITISRTAAPAESFVRSLRMSSIERLKSLFSKSKSLSESQAILARLFGATRSYPGGESNADTDAMVAEHTTSILKFLIEVVNKQPLQLIQKIEHDSYWIFRHCSSEDTRRIALQLKDEIDRNSEYQIYKFLVGYEGIFSEWDDKDSSDDYLEQDSQRKAKATELADSISDENFDEWRERILLYAETKSDDLATFQYFSRFLERFAEISPHLAMKLVTDNLDEIQNFLISLLAGVWKTDYQSHAEQFAREQILSGNLLWVFAALVKWIDLSDERFVEAIFEQAVERGDSVALIRLIDSALSKYAAGSTDFVRRYFIPAIKELHRLKEYRWVNELWFRKERRQILEALEQEEIDILLAAMLHKKEIDYHSESILSIIARKFPNEILDFFVMRLGNEKTNDSAIDAVPYRFHKLHKEFVGRANLVVSKIAPLYLDDDTLFQFRGGRLAHNLFPEFTEELRTVMLEMWQSKNENYDRYLITLLQSYNGASSINDICEELVCSLPGGHELIRRLAWALHPSGTTWGEFGRAEQLERKANELRPWLEESKPRILREFASTIINSLEAQAGKERKRAEQEIELRKHEWGEDSNSGNKVED